MILENLFKNLQSLSFKALERNLLPDLWIRAGIRRLLKERLKTLDSGKLEVDQERLRSVKRRMSQGPLAIHSETSKRQHYEVPTEFFQKVLGVRLKYSCAFWDIEHSTLDRAEKKMFELYVERAKIQSGQHILELGCGWGSFCLYLAKRFPHCQITAVSHSQTQRQYILSQIKNKDIQNLKVITANLSDFDTTKKFDRIVSIELLEHLRNWKKTFQHISTWLKPRGLFFFHIFCHRRWPYFFEAESKNDWMAEYFFSGGVMPSIDLPLYFQDDLTCIDQWIISGIHYQKTAEAWLKRMDQNRDEIQKIFQEFYAPKDALKWWVYWRVFFMACAELWGYKQGQEWVVGHYLFQKD